MMGDNVDGGTSARCVAVDDSAVTTAGTVGWSAYAAGWLQGSSEAAIRIKGRADRFIISIPTPLTGGPHERPARGLVFNELPGAVRCPLEVGKTAESCSLDRRCRVA